MEQNVIETVMKELLDEEKISNIKLDEVKDKLDIYETEISHFKQHLKEVRLSVPPIDTSQVESKLATHLKKVESEMSTFKQFIEGERKNQRLKDVLLYWFGWILLTALFIILLVLAFKWNGRRFY